MNKETLYSLYCTFYDELAIDEDLIFIESHNSMDLAGNMFYIIKEIEENAEFRQFNICVSVTEKSKHKVMAYIDNYSFKRIKMIFRESEEYMRILATAKYLFTDVAFYPLFRKKRGQLCITTWHGTPLKTLGYTYWEDSYVVPNQKRGFLLSDYFICPNKYTWECIRQSYELDTLFRGKVLFNGYPRNSVLLNKDRNRQLRNKLKISDEKKIVVYMPTWRGKVIDVNDEEQSQLLQDYLDQLDTLIPDDYEIWAKLHRLNEVNLDFSDYKHIRRFPGEYETYDLLNVADILVTDYSSVMFDFAVTKKKIILFCYDKNDYVTKRKCYFDINDLPFPIVENVEQLAKEITTCKSYEDKECIKKFCAEESIDSCEKLLKCIFYKYDTCNVEVVKSVKCKKILYVGDLRKGKETDSIFDYLNDLKNEKIYISYMTHLFLNNPYKLLQVKKYNKIPMYMFQGMYSTYTQLDCELIDTIKKFIKNDKKITDDLWDRLDVIYSRELQRYTYQNKFDMYIRFAGLDLESLKFFSVFKGEKILYVHENMIEKAKANKEFFVFLQRAMKKATKIYYANKEIFDNSELLNKGVHSKKVIANLY